MHDNIEISITLDMLCKVYGRNTHSSVLNLEHNICLLSRPNAVLYSKCIINFNQILLLWS